MRAPEFIKVATLGEIPPGERKVTAVEGVVIVIVNLDGQHYAFEGKCPHRGGPLQQGHRWDDAIECPWHHFRFDIRTGENIYPKNVYPNLEELQRDLKPLRMFSVQVEGQDIKVRWP